jgi:hypothetical protein
MMIMVSRQICCRLSGSLISWSSLIVISNLKVCKSSASIGLNNSRNILRNFRPVAS